jgi:hypothetical protein
VRVELPAVQGGAGAPMAGQPADPVPGRGRGEGERQHEHLQHVEHAQHLQQIAQALPLTAAERAAVVAALRGETCADDFDERWIAEFVRRSPAWTAVPRPPALNSVGRETLVRKLRQLSADEKLALAGWVEQQLWPWVPPAAPGAPETLHLREAGGE